MINASFACTNGFNMLNVARYKLFLNYKRKNNFFTF